MLLSHEYRFIFISTHKTASTSTAIALSRYCGPLDVVPKLDEEAEAIRREMGIHPRNYLAELPDYTARDYLNLLLKSGRKRLKRRFRAHMPTREIRPLVGDRIWNSYFKFSFDRNPWDRQVSHYFFNTRKKRRRPSFDHWMKTSKRARLSNFDVYAIDGEVAVDFLGRFENLEGDLARVFDHLGIKDTVEMPHAKSHYRGSQKPYRDYYTDETREMVRRWYADEIAVLGAEF